MVIQHCEDALDDVPPDKFTLGNVSRVIERVLVEDHAAHVFPHPEPRPNVEFLAGVYSPVSKKVGFSPSRQRALIGCMAMTVADLGRTWVISC